MMSKSVLSLGLCAALSLCGTAPVLAGNVSFMKDSALSNMTEADVEAMRAAARTALDDGEDGVTVNWSNAETGASGSLTPQATSASGESVCRRLQIVNTAGGQTGRSAFDFCRQPDGTWKIPAGGGTAAQ